MRQTAREAAAGARLGIAKGRKRKGGKEEVREGSRRSMGLIEDARHWQTSWKQRSESGGNLQNRHKQRNEASKCLEVGALN